MCVCVCMYMAERRVTGTYTGHMHTQNSLTPGIQRAGEVHGCSSPLLSTRDGTPTQRQAVLLSPGRNSPQVAETKMAAPRGALDWTAAAWTAMFGMGPTAPTQAERPVAHAWTLRSNDPKKVYSYITGARDKCIIHNYLGSYDPQEVYRCTTYPPRWWL